jgi:restriction system protein
VKLKGNPKVTVNLMGRKKQNGGVPSYDELIIPTVTALIELGGSGTVDEINSKVYEIAKLSDAILQLPHGEEGNISEVDYRLAWSRTYLKKYGLLENSSRAVWALLKANIDVSKLDYNQIVKFVREESKLSQPNTKILKEDLTPNGIAEYVDNTEEWKEILLNLLYNISPAAFERLAQRLLRESGFFQVDVTGKSGDGGIDGKGIVRVSGLLSFHVIFQCKRYRGSVTPSQIRDFRGAMQGRADKGLVITTGKFTREAVKEATRDGAPPIDLIDGELLCDKLKELKLGVETVLTENVNINNDWYTNL